MAGIIIIDQERCKGCDYCITACPHELVEKASFLNSKGYYPAAYKDSASCPGKGCTLCALVCPEVAIEVLKEEKENPTSNGGKNEKNSNERK